MTTFMCMPWRNVWRFFFLVFVFQETARVSPPGMGSEVEAVSVRYMVLPFWSLINHGI